jgi:hypothetical protein
MVEVVEVREEVVKIQQVRHQVQANLETVALVNLVE